LNRNHALESFIDPANMAQQLHPLHLATADHHEAIKGSRGGTCASTGARSQ
jgi:hypothetical protein